MNYIIFDLDDTLLNDERQVSDYTLDILKRLQGMGHKIVINTARSKGYTQEIFDRIRPDYAILNGGALIIDGQERAVFRAQIDQAETLAVIETLLGLTENFSIQTEADLFSNNGSYTGQNAKSFDFAHEKFPYPALKIVAAIQDDRQAAAVAEKFGLEFTTYLGGPFRRYNHVSATKALGNRNLVALTGGRMEDVLAFGDDLGDLDMLREAGVGVLMKNAKPELHDGFAHVSRFTNDQDGVARFLAAYFDLEA